MKLKKEGWLSKIGVSMLTIISVLFLCMKILGIVNVSWNVVLLCEIIFLSVSYLELRLIYKWIDKRFKWDHSFEWSFYFAHKNRPLPGNSGQEINEKDVRVVRWV